jgi:hypothetical protein
VAEQLLSVMVGQWADQPWASERTKVTDHAIL